MDRIWTSLAVSGGIMLLSAASAIAGSNFPTKPFDATYTVTTGSNTSDLRMCTDGKGHMRAETVYGNYRSVTLMDYTDMTQTSLVEQGKMAMKSKIPPEGGYVTDAETAKKANAKPIGTKTVAGHPCHGWAYTTPSGKSEVWTGDDIGAMVLSTTEGPGGKTVTSLKSFSKNAPAAGSFAVPAGYKMTNM